MRNLLVFSTSLVIILLVNLQALRYEAILDNGETVLLRLAPIDPRSLMQGDYMILRYEQADLYFEDVPEQARSGSVILELDQHGVGTIRRLDDGRDLGENEVRLRYKRRTWDLWLAPESFFFQEGTGHVYQRGAYAELKVSPTGHAMLAGLRDDDFRVLSSEGVEPRKVDPNGSQAF